MKIRIPHFPLLAVATISLAGCERKTPPAVTPAAPAVPLVPVAAQSKAFGATVSHLDVGGPVFCFLETEGDAQRIADALLGLATLGARLNPGMPAPPKTLAPFIGDLGLANIHATGFSSRLDGPGFVNRTFLYTPGGPSGILTLFGSKNEPFVSPGLAPADTAFLTEMQFDGAKLVAVLRALASHIADGGKTAKQLDEFLAAPLPNLPFSGEQLVGMLSGKMFVGASFKEGALHIGNKTAPGMMLAVALDGRADLFTRIRVLGTLGGDKAPFAYAAGAGLQTLTWRAPAGAGAPDFKPVIALEKSGRVWIATNRETLDKWMKPEGPKLSGDAAFIRQGAGLTPQGTSMYYVSSEAGKYLREEIAVLLPAIGAAVPRESRAAFSTGIGVYVSLIEALFPEKNGARRGVSFVTPDGLGTESRGPFSTKADAYFGASGGVTTIATTGVMASLAVPALKKARNAAVEKSLVNDARQLSSAANQWWAEHGETSCIAADLVGPTSYISFLSDGTRIGVTSGDNHPGLETLVNVSSPEAKKLTLKAGSRLVLGNEKYERALSSNPSVKTSPGTTHTLEFEIDTGSLAH